MASKSEQVFILLKAIGAANTRRDIDSVASALDKLNSRMSKNTDAIDDNSAAIKDNIELSKKKQKLLDDNLDTTNKTIDANKALTKEIERQQRALNNLTKAQSHERRLRTQEENDRKRAMRLERTQQERHATQLLKMYENAYKENDRITAANRKKSISMLTMHLKKQMQIEKEYIVARKKRDQSLSKIRLPGFAKPGRVLLIAGVIAGVLELVPLLASAIGALGAGSIAIVNGLAPIATFFAGVLPAGIASLLQFGIVSKMVFGGLLSAMNGNKAALKKLGPNAREFVKQTEGVVLHWKDMRDNIREIGLKGLANTFRDVSEKYLPFLNTQLGKTAAIINKNIKSAGNWLTAPDTAGFATMTSIIKRNKLIIDSTLKSVGNLTRVFLYLADAGGKSFRLMMEDFQKWSKGLARTTLFKGQELEDFFESGRKSATNMFKTVGKFGKGLFRVFRSSSPMTKWLSGKAMGWAKSFDKWTSKKSNQKKMSQYFKDMKKPLAAVGKLALKLVTTLFELSKSPGFTKIMDSFSKDGGLIDSITKIIKAIDGQFIDIIAMMVQNLQKMADSGALQKVLDAIKQIIKVTSTLVNIFAAMPPWLMKAVVTVTIILGLFGSLINRAVQFAAAIRTAVGATIALWKAQKKLNSVRPLIGPNGGVVGGPGKKPKKQGPSRPAGHPFVQPPRQPKKTKPPKTRTPSLIPKSPISNGKAAAGAAGVAGGLLMLGPLFNLAETGIKGMESKAATAINNIEVGSRGATEAVADIFGANASYSIDTFSEAMNMVLDPSKFQSFSGGFANFLGVDSNIDTATRQLGELDTNLSNLGTMSGPKAAIVFSKLGQAAGLTKDNYGQLLTTLPSYRSQLEATLTPTEMAIYKTLNAADATQMLANKASHAADKVSSFEASLTKLPQQTQTDLKLIGATQGIDKAIEFKNKLDKLPKSKRSKILSIFEKKGYNAANAALDKIGKKTVNPKIAPKLSAGGSAILSSVRSKLQAIAGTFNSYVNIFKTTTTKTKEESFAGNMLSAGQQSYVGEMGPEFSLTKSGRLGLVGTTGTEIFNPTVPTAIIPASATSNPFSGNYGNAPDWAKRMLQSSFSGGDTRKPLPQNAYGDDHQFAAPTNNNFDFRGATFGGGSDVSSVKTAVLAAIKESERDRKERR